MPPYEGSSTHDLAHDFILFTKQYILIPTPLAIASDSYVNLYASFHANPEFCQMAFGHHFPPRTWSSEEARDVITTRDIKRSWDVRGMGDFAIGIRPASVLWDLGEKYLEYLIVSQGKMLDGILEEVRQDKIEWVGYVGIRDATTTSLPNREERDPPLPDWREMVEIRYGVAPAYWGKGVAREAALAVMAWGKGPKKVRRYIAETEKENSRSGRVLEKMGFKLSGTNYFKEESEVEWERVVEDLYWLSDVGR